MKGVILVIAIMTSVGGVATTSFAGPPLITDDPYTPAANHWEINLAFTLEQLHSGRTYDLPQLDANYGAGNHVQLNVEVPYQVQDERGAGPFGGIGDTALGAKWRFLDEDTAGFAMSTFPKIVVNSPGTQSVGRGLVESGSTFILPVQFGKSFGKIDVFADAGWRFIQHGDDDFYTGVAAGWHATEKTLLLAEFHLDVDSDFRRQSSIVQLGIAQTVNEHLNLLFSAGRSLRGGDDDPQLLVYFAFQFEY